MLATLLSEVSALATGCIYICAGESEINSHNFLSAGQKYS